MVQTSTWDALWCIVLNCSVLHDVCDIIIVCGLYCPAGCLQLEQAQQLADEMETIVDLVMKSSQSQITRDRVSRKDPQQTLLAVTCFAAGLPCCSTHCSIMGA